MTNTRHHSSELGPSIDVDAAKWIMSATKRMGYLVGAAANGVMLWIAHQLLDWEWPGFLTPEFEDLLPIITVSFAAGILTNLAYAWSDSWPIKPIGELTNAVIGFVVALRTWQIFPFDFTGADWSRLVRLILVVTLFGTAMSAIAQLVKLARGPSNETKE